MFIDKAIAEFLRHRLEIDFPSMEFVQQAAVSPTVYRGPGNLRQHADNRIELTCYADTPDDDRGLEGFLDKLSTTPKSMLVDESEYYQTTANQFGSATWISGQTQISTSSGLSHAKTIVRSSPYMLKQTTDKVSPRFGLRMWFSQQRSRHWMALVGEHQLANDADSGIDYAFSLKVEEEGDECILVSMMSSVAFPPDFKLRILETLRFVCALPLHPSVVDEFGNGVRTVELWPAGLSPDSHVPSAPLRMNGQFATSDVLRLFELFLRYVLKEGIPDLVHLSSVQLDHMRQNQKNSVGAQAIATSVAAEGIANLHPAPTRTDKEAAELTACGQQLVEALSSGSWSDQVRARVKGFSTNLKEVRAIDRMHALAATGHVLEEDIDAWKYLRNKWVHAAPTNLNEHRRNAMEANINGLQSVTRLIYCMIFSLIGFEGPFTDCANPKFPERAYPFTPPKAT